MEGDVANLKDIVRLSKQYYANIMVDEAHGLGVLVNPVIPPACSPEDTLIRFSLMATHTQEQVERAIDIIVKCFKKLDLLH